MKKFFERTIYNCLISKFRTILAAILFSFYTPYMTRKIKLLGGFFHKLLR